MKIFRSDPVDWRDLQNLVATIFTDIGCNAKTEEKVVVTARGEDPTIEVDVWVEDARKTPTSFYLVECKHWKDNIPQEKVIALAEYLRITGANTGFLISKAGFQRGATKHAEGKNIKLLTFDEFQEHFWNTWVLDFFKRKTDEIQHDFYEMQSSLHPDLYRGNKYGDLSHHFPDNLSEFDGFLSWHCAFNGRLSYLTAHLTLPPHALEPEMLSREINWDEIDNMISAANAIAGHSSRYSTPYQFTPSTKHLRATVEEICNEYERIKNSLIHS